METQLRYIRLLVDDFRGGLRFYRDTLGLTVLRGDLDAHYAEFEGKGVRLALFQRSAMSEAIGIELPKGGDGSLALVLEVEDVDQAFRELEGRGVRFIMAPRTHEEWGVRTAHLRDPNGNLIEINERLNKKPSETSTAERQSAMSA